MGTILQLRVTSLAGIPAAAKPCLSKPEAMAFTTMVSGLGSSLCGEPLALLTATLLCLELPKVTTMAAMIAAGYHGGASCSSSWRAGLRRWPALTPPRDQDQTRAASPPAAAAAAEVGPSQCGRGSGMQLRLLCPQWRPSEQSGSLAARGERRRWLLAWLIYSDGSSTASSGGMAPLSRCWSRVAWTHPSPCRP